MISAIVQCLFFVGSVVVGALIGNVFYIGIRYVIETCVARRNAARNFNRYWSGT